MPGAPPERELIAPDDFITMEVGSASEQDMEHLFSEGCGLS